MRSGSSRKARSSSPDGHDGRRPPLSRFAPLGVPGGCGARPGRGGGPAPPECEPLPLDREDTLPRWDPKSRLGSRLRQRVELLGTVLAVVRDQSGVRPLTRLRLDAIRIGDATVRANEVDASLEPLPSGKGEDRIESIGSEFFQAANLLRAARIDPLGD